MTLLQDDRAIQLGHLLQSWRECKGLTRPEMVAEVQKLGVKLSANYLAKLELGFRPLANASLDIREALRIILGIPEDDWRYQTGLYVPLDFRERSQEPEDANIICFPVVSNAAVGHTQAEPLEGKRAYIPIEQLRSADPQRVRVFLAQDNCLLSQSVRTSSKGVNVGDYVAFEMERSPKADDIIVAFDEETQKLILKREVETDTFVILYPLAGSEPPIVEMENSKSDPLGVVIWRGGSV